MARVRSALRRPVAVALVLGVAATVPAAAAEDVAGPVPAAGASAGPSGPPGGGRWLFGLRGAALHQYRADLKDSQGSFSVDRAALQGSLGYAFSRQTGVSLGLGFGESSYSFTNQVSVGGGEPWGRIHDYRLSLPVRFGVGPRVNAIVIPSLRAYAEKGASLDDGRTEGLLAGFSWRFSARLEIGPGIGWFSQIEDSANLFPILVIDWDITERLKLSTGRGLAATQGPGLTLDWQVSDKISLGLAGRYERLRFRLDDTGPAPGGVGEDRSIPLILTLSVVPWRGTAITAFTGLELDGDLRLENSQGQRIASTGYDPAPLLGLAFRARF